MRPSLLHRLAALTRGLSLPLLILLLSSCATSRPLLESRGEGGAQWPEAPFAARIQWVNSVLGPEDAGISKGFWKRALEVLTGPEVQRISKPYGVLYDDAGGRLMVADPGSGVVHIMDTRRGKYLQLRGGEGAPFASPIGLAQDESNRLYITDSAANAVYRYDLESGALTPFLREMDRPTGIAYNRVNKMLYISETTARRVTVVDQEGSAKFSFGGRPGVDLSQFNLPTDLATDAKGQVYVVDPLNYRVKIFTPEGVMVREFGEMGDTRGELSKPKGIAVDAEGRIFLSDAMHDAVQIFDDEGRFLFSFGGTGTEDGAFWMPSGLCITGNYIFVSDSFNRRVQVFRYYPAAPDQAKNQAYRLQTTKR